MKRTGPAFQDFITEQKRKNKSAFLDHGFSINLELIAPISAAIVFAFLVIRLFYLQVVQAQYFKDLSDGNRTRTERILAERGVIFDAKGRQIARNTAKYQIKENGKDKNLSEDEALKKIADGNKNKIQLKIKREYPYQDIFSHLTGFVGSLTEDELLTPEYRRYNINDNIGKSGLEKQYEILLKGVDGKKLYEVDARGKIIGELGSADPIPGQDINTTLDADIQTAVFEAMIDVEKGAAIVSDPRDGGILALYSKPSYDPNLFTMGDDYEPKSGQLDLEAVLEDTNFQPLLNRAISGIYPPGSTFKLITAAAALEDGVITEDTEIEDTGVLKIGEFSYGNWYFSQYGKKEGNLNITGAIRRSNDIFFYKISQSLGVEKLVKASKQFGVGERLGIDLPEEEKGLIPSPIWKEQEIGEDWYLGDTFHMGIGQGFLLTTPLQVNAFTQVFANDGILYKPHIFASKIEILRRDFIKKHNIDLIRTGMKQACEPGGTGWPLFEFKIQNSKIKIDNLDYTPVASIGAGFIKVSLGCKTGTAETTPDQKPHAWITVFAPYYNPEVVVTVLVEHGGEGSSVAGPIAKKILEKYFENR